MATATRRTRRPSPRRPSVSEPRIVLHQVPWAGYDCVLSWVGDRSLRVTYDRGRLEIMSPSQPHEEYAKILGWIVDLLVEEFDVPYTSLRCVTLRREDLERGLEPDDCFYIKRFDAVAGRKELDFRRDPPPDLAIEVDVTSSSIDRLAIYGSLGVPEIWRYADGAVKVLTLRANGRYASARQSPSFPRIGPADLTRWLKRADRGDKLAWRKACRGWIRERLSRGGRGNRSQESS